MTTGQGTQTTPATEVIEQQSPVSNNPETQAELERQKQEQEALKDKTIDQGVQRIQTRVDAQNLQREALETQRYNNTLHTLEIVKGTELYERMKTVLSNSVFDKYSDLKGKDAEKRIEVVFSKINIVLTKFLERKFSIDSKEPIPDHIKNIVLPATERYLMDILEDSGHDTNANFLGEISKINMDSISSLFKDVNNFSNKFTIPFKRGKALLNILDFLSLPKNQEQVKKIKNPYELYKNVFKNPIFENTFVTEGNNIQEIVNINNITWEQFGLSDLQGNLTQEQLEEKLKNGKDEIKGILGSIKMDSTKTDTVEKLLGVLNKADSFLNSTKKMGESMIDSIDGVGNMSQAVNHAFGFDAWDILKNMEKQSVIGGILTMVLSLMGFSGGIGGIEKARKKRKLDREITDEKRNYITETFDYYMVNKNSVEKKQEDNVLDIIKNDLKVNLDAKYNEKFNINLTLLKDKISENLDKNFTLLNPATLLSINSDTFKGKNMVVEVKENNKKVLKLNKNSFTPQEKEEFIKLYISEIFKFYTTGGNTEKLKDADTLAFSIIAGITLKKDDVVDGVEAEVFLPSQFYNSGEAPRQLNEGEETQVVYGENLNYSTNEVFPENKKQKLQEELKDAPINADDILNSCKKENIPIEYMMAIIKERTNYGKNSGTNEKKNIAKLKDSDTTEKTFTTRQEGLDVLAKDIKNRMDGYKGVYGVDKIPWITYLLENKGPDGKGFISNIGNYKEANDYQGETPPKGSFVIKKEETNNIKTKVEELRNNLNQ